MKTYIEQVTKLPIATAVRVPSCTLILLNENAQLLLLKNKADRQWQLPLTHIQPAETATTTTLRLANEQTRVTVEDIECVGYASAASENMLVLAGTQVHLHSFIMVSTTWQGQVKPGLEFTEAQFFSIQSLPELPGHTLQAIRLFKKWLPSRVFQFG